jgi:hypothetical protein
VDLLMLVAPVVALAAHRQLGRVTPLLWAAGLPSLLALPMALIIKETRGTRTSPAKAHEMGRSL